MKYGKLTNMIEDLEFGENIKILSFNKIVLKKYNKEKVELNSPFITPEEYNETIESIINEKDLEKNMDSLISGIKFFDKDKLIQVHIISPVLTSIFYEKAHYFSGGMNRL